MEIFIIKLTYPYFSQCQGKLLYRTGKSIVNMNIQDGEINEETVEIAKSSYTEYTLYFGFMEANDLFLLNQNRNRQIQFLKYLTDGVKLLGTFLIKLID